ncbi:MAG: PucC family protein, partial [Rhizobiaceae bacterium]|nr:PucC family protein [Rhizobiaceae bacterium]
GAAQAIGFGLGGLAGTVAVDLTELATGSVVASYAGVFAFEGLVFLAAASLALGIRVVPKSATATPDGPRRGPPMRILGATGADLQPAE